MRANNMRAGVLLIFLLLASSAIIPMSVKAYSGEKTHIVATLQIFATLAEKVGGEMVSVDYIVPQGMDIHSYSLKYEDVKKLERGDLIILASSEFFSLDNSILQKFQNKEILDFSDYNATIYPLDGIERNLHGYWLYPQNALNIARAIEKKLEKINPANSRYYRENLIKFENELNEAITIINTLKRECDLQNSTALLAVPGTYYIVKAMGIKIEGSIVKGPNQFIGSEEIEKIKEKIKRGEIDFVVNAYGLEDSRAGQIARQFSAETGIRVVYVDIFSAENYTSLLLKDASILSGASYVSIYGVSEENHLPYIIIITLLSAIIAVAFFEVYLCRRELLR